MENIKLLNKHKKKTVFWHAFVKFAFIYLCILTFLFTSVYFRSVNEDNTLISKVSRIATIVKNQQILSEDTEIKGIEKRVLQNTYIYNESWQVLSYIDDEVLWLQIKDDVIAKVDGYKYYSTTIEKGEEIYHVLARGESNNFLSEIVMTLFVITLIGPILYYALVKVSEYWLNKAYRPIEEIIESLEWFAVNINHEFKTSLSEIISSLELAKITNEYGEATDQSIDSAKRLNSTLDSLSLMIHFVNTDYRKEKFNVIQELDKSIDDFIIQMKDKGTELVKEYEVESSLTIFTDKAPLVLCFTNILKNAIRYSHENWKIEVSIEKDHFKIKDYWVWIAKENLNKIFERHFRESYAGKWTGIWLSLVKKITDIYDWEVDISSEKGLYTEIKLFF